MKSLYESILDDQDEVMDRMTDQMRYKAIETFLNTSLWPWPDPKSKFYGVKYKYGKDKDGFYIETEGHIRYTRNGDCDCKNFNEWKHSREIYNEKWPETHKGNLCPEFRWKSHKGSIVLSEGLQNVESLEGIPDNKIESLFIDSMCGCRNHIIDLSNKQIKKVRLHQVGRITLKGNSKTKIDEIEWTRSYNSVRPTLQGFNCKNMHEEARTI